MTRLTITSADKDGTRYQLLHDILELYGFCNNFPVYFNGEDMLEIHDEHINGPEDLTDIEGNPYNLDGIEVRYHAENFNSYKGEVSVEISKDSIVKEIYKAAFPSDDRWADLTGCMTLGDVLYYLEEGMDACYILAIHDSVIRERVFDMTSVVCGVKYSYLYNLWLNS